MKRVVLSAVFGLMLGASALSAQIATTTIANIPYDFVANGVPMKAGRYNIEVIGTFVRVAAADRSVAVVMPLNAPQTSVHARPEAEVLLKRKGNELHLVAVREPGSSVVRVVAPNY
jgi:hypothetical protein